MPPATRLGDLCIDGDTVIPLLDGTKQKIKDLVGQKDFYVYSIDLKTKEIVPGLVEKVWLTGYSECLKIILDNNETLIVTPDHKMIDINGKFVKAKDLKICSLLLGGVNVFKIIQSYSVKNIEKLEGIRPVYNMTVSDTHTYALDIGIFIKNCTGHSP